jgi:hypothetical protein
MTELCPALITYDGLPLSAGGAHRIRGRERGAIWASVLHFLESFTTYRESSEVRLLVHEGPRVDGAFFETAHRTAMTSYGPGQRRLAIAGEVGEYEHSWRRGPAHIADALGLMQTLEPFPEHWLGGPLVLSIGASFQLCDPERTLLLAESGAVRRSGGRTRGPAGALAHLRAPHYSFDLRPVPIIALLGGDACRDGLRRCTGSLAAVSPLQEALVAMAAQRPANEIRQAADLPSGHLEARHRPSAAAPRDMSDLKLGTR